MKLDKPLQGNRIVIRNHEKSDLAFISGMWFDEENGRYMSDPTPEYIDETYRNILEHLDESTDGYYLIVQLAATGEPIGTAGVFPTEEGVYDIGYCVHKSRWRQGFGSEIVALLLDWLKANHASKVMAEVAMDNLPSNLLLQKFGFTVEKTSQFKKYRMDTCFNSNVYAKYL